ncbi:hypothetical protein MMC17_004597 [Xylographa soralifera]|nr:hypothetical protein [Xylographa soralifera]
MLRVPAVLKQVVKYPLAQRLNENKRLTKLYKGSSTERIQVVSPELCGKAARFSSRRVRDILTRPSHYSDDALRRLESTLRSYVGCDIIDINPGACLWSTKIHELLKPRRHILVEPLHNVYNQFLRPLVDAPGSRYTLADTSSLWDRWNLGDYFEKDLLPEQAHLEEPELGSPGGNNTLLIVANMSQNRRTYADRAAAHKILDSHYKALEFVRALETRSGFHSKGPVRMLMWMSDQDKINFLPRTTSSRRRISVYNELFCDVEEIVGDALGPHATRREAYIDLQSSLLTAERMKKDDIDVPVTRMDELPRKLRSEGIDAVMQSTRYNDSAIHGERTWHKELHDLREGFANGSYSQFVGGPPGFEEKKRKSGDLAITPEFKKFQLLVRTEKNQRNKKAVVDQILSEDAQIRARQLAIASNVRLDEIAHKKDIQELDELIDRYNKLLARQTDVRLNSVHFFADDRVAWSGDSSLLLWDHRNAEPIVPQANEFHISKPLALLDFRPKVSSMNVLTTVQRKYLDDILFSFFATPGFSITAALDAMAPGAAEAIIPKARSLRDPRRGGRIDLDQLRVRVLTPEMLQEIAVAWDGWLFKPTHV